MKLPAPIATPRARGIAPKPWGVPAILLSLALPLLLWGSSLAITVAQGEQQDLSAGEVIVGLIFTIILLDGLFIALPAAICLWRYGLRWSDLGLRPFDGDLWWLPLAAAGGAHVGIIAYGALLILFGADSAVPEQDVEDLFDSRAVLPMVGLATVIMAPLAEELFFRGFVFAGLVRPFGLGGAMVVSGLVFGLFHVTSVDTLGLVFPFALVGMLFAWLYYRTGSLWPSIGAHFVFNLVSFAVLASTASTIRL